MEKITFTVCDPVGLHARPATVLVNAAGKFTSEVKLNYNDKSINLKSIMGLLSIGVPTRAVVEITAEGEDAKAAVEALLNVVKEQNIGE